MSHPDPAMPCLRPLRNCETPQDHGLDGVGDGLKTSASGFFGVSDVKHFPCEHPAWRRWCHDAPSLLRVLPCALASRATSDEGAARLADGALGFASVRECHPVNGCSEGPRPGAAAASASRGRPVTAPGGCAVIASTPTDIATARYPAGCRISVRTVIGASTSCRDAIVLTRLRSVCERERRIGHRDHGSGGTALDGDTSGSTP